MSVLVIDTCELHRQFRLDGPRIEALIKFCERFDIEFVVSRIVIEEHIHDFRGQIEEVYSKAKKYHQLLKVISTTEPTLMSIEDAVAEYRRFVTDWANEHGRIAELRDKDSHLLLTKVVERRKPFNGEGGGFPDALLWLTVMDLASEDEVLFVSSNSRDFGGKDGLHAHLLDDLASKGISTDRIQYFSGFAKFQENYMRPRGEHQDRREALMLMENELERGESDLIDLCRWAHENFNSLHPEILFDWWDLGIPWDFEDVEYFGLMDVLDIEEVSVTEASESSLLISFDVYVRLIFQATASGVDFSEEYPELQLEIVVESNEFDWETRSFNSVVRGQVEVKASISISIDKQNKEVLSSELIKISR